MIDRVPSIGDISVRGVSHVSTDQGERQAQERGTTKAAKLSRQDIIRLFFTRFDRVTLEQ
jgi:hypothetical protein